MVTAADLASRAARPAFWPAGFASQLALLAVESLKVDFEELARDRIGICLATSAGSLSTDVNFWQGRNGVGGPSPTLFAYTLPSAAVGEIAIHYQADRPEFMFRRR